MKKQKILLNKNISIMDNLFKQSFGLMFRKKQSEFAMIFKFKKPRKMSIHMMFVFFPIDILLLDKDNKVIELRENLLPFRLYNSSSKKIKTFIELPKNFISEKNIHIGDKINWTSSNMLLKT